MTLKSTISKRKTREARARHQPRKPLEERQPRPAGTIYRSWGRRNWWHARQRERPALAKAQPLTRTKPREIALTRLMKRLPFDKLRAPVELEDGRVVYSSFFVKGEVRLPVRGIEARLGVQLRVVRTTHRGFMGVRVWRVK